MWGRDQGDPMMRWDCDNWFWGRTGSVLICVVNPDPREAARVLPAGAPGTQHGHHALHRVLQGF